MKRKIIAFLLLTFFVFSVFSPLTVQAKSYENEDSLTSDSVAVFNVEKGFVVYGKSEHAL